MKLHFESLDASYNYSSFDCGNEALNQFLVTRSKTEEGQRLSKTKIAKSENDEVVGFYTVSPTVVAKQSLASSEARGIPYPEIPAIRIGRLAVHKKYQRTGVGKTILQDALMHCLRISNQLGGRVVIVDAKNEKVASFLYESRL